MQLLLLSTLNSTSIIIAFAILLLLLLCSGLISGAEVAYFSISPQNRKTLEDNNKKGKYHTVLTLLEQPERLLATILIANNFVNIGIVILSKYISDNIFNLENSPILKFLIEIVIITFLILLFGEIIPKIYANRNPLSFATFMGRTLAILEKIFYPFSSFMISSTKLITNRIKKERKISLDELSQAIEIAADDIDDEREILEGIVRFSNITASEVMCSRVDVIAADINYSFTKLKSIIIDSGYSRIPVFVKNLDNIRGVLYVKDLLPHLDKPTTFRWQTLIRQPFFVPENKKINDLLQDFQTKRMHMAIVVDEYGGSSGIITLEDVLEQIVGDISDENDEENKWYTSTTDGCYIFEGKTPIDYFEQTLKIEEGKLLGEDIEADSLAGLLLAIKGAFPEKNEEIEYLQFQFTPISIDERRIKQIKVCRKKDKAKQIIKSN